ncbi:MAG: nuclear transport factor 2 family protein [Cyanobacteria bacterium SBC]|nr:nuclear transport factor 2 family protein [Cyanobacteria bacterium SBC]
MSKESIEQVLNDHFANLSTMNPDGWRKNFAEDAVVYDPVGSPPSYARDDANKFFGFLSQYYNSLEVAPLEIYIAGNAAAVKWRMEVSAKNGKTAQAEGISVFEFNDAVKIQKISAYWDDKALVAQLRG